jgi:hypothetical protein
MLHQTKFDEKYNEYALLKSTAKLCLNDKLSPEGIAQFDNITDIIFDYLRPVKCIFNVLTPSTLTAQGMLSNTSFEERDLIYAVIAAGRIQKIVCNYGEVHNPDFKEKKIVKKTTNRGRKPKEKKKNKRKNQGSGKRFNSQISFWVCSDVKADKVYKIKVFRNGRLEIPGGLEPSMRDVRSAALIVETAMENCFCEGVKMTELYSIMRNYKFKTMDPEIRINIRALFQIFIKAKQDGDDDVTDLNEIKYNVERYPGLIVKFSTPIPRNHNKKTTIKMFNSGKVNIDGAISEECALHYYRWINEFYVKHADEIVYTPRDYSDSDSDDADGDADDDADEDADDDADGDI